MSVRRRHAGVVAAAATVTLGCGQGDRSGDDQRLGEPPETRSEGSFARLTLPQLTARATLVVRGTPTSDEVRRFRDNDQLPAAARETRSYRSDGRYHDVRVRVREYLKGDGPRHISVRRPAGAAGTSPQTSTGGASDIPAPRRGQQQIFFLDPGPSVWSGGFLLTSPQSLARVKKDTAIFPTPFPDRGREVPLSVIRDMTN